MKIICVNYLILLLVNFAFNLANADNSTRWPLVDAYQDYSTVLPKPADSTKPSVSETINLTDATSVRQADQLKHSEANQDDANLALKLTLNEAHRSVEPTTVNRSSTDLVERSRTSKYLLDSTSVIPFGTKLSKQPVDLSRNQSFANVDLHTNMSVISGRSSTFDDASSAQSKSGDPFTDDKYLQHLSAYDRIKIKNDKFQYDNFFQLYDQATDDPDEQKDVESSKNAYQEVNQYPYQHLVQYRPANILPFAAQYPAQQYPQPYPQQYNSMNYYSPYEYPIPFNQPSTMQKFKKYQKQRIKELLHRPVSEMFAGKFQPDYVPKYSLEAPQRSHQQTGLGELFIILGPLVILPLLSSFALSTFTTLYVTKSLIAKPATTARHKQFDGKLLKEESLNHTLFRAQPDDTLMAYHPFNASDYDIQLLKSRNGSTDQHRNKSDRKSDATELKHPNERKDRAKFASVDDLTEESLKGLKRFKRNLRHDRIRKELGLEDEELIGGKRRVRRSWNEVLWTRPKQLQQSPWLPLTKKLARQPRNSLHNKLYIVRPTKKVYKKIAKDSKHKGQHLNSTIRNEANHNFNQPSNLLRFAINDAVANAKQLANFESKFDTGNDGKPDTKLDHLQSAASSPSPTYLNFSTAFDSNANTFTGPFNSPETTSPTSQQQPKLYSLRTTNNPAQNGQLIKRNSVSNLFVGDTTPSLSTAMMSSNQPASSQQTYRSSSSSFPISTSNNDTVFQRIALLNPFHKPTFLADNNAAGVRSSNQARSKSARKLDLNSSPNSDPNWDKDVFDTIPLDDWTENFTNKNYPKQKESHEVSTLNSDLDVVQKYLKQTRPDGEYNDEIIATYLTCNGLLSKNNQCLQRLVCQYVDESVQMENLQKEVASLIIYAILKNKYIDDEVKSSMRQAAQMAYQQKHGQCSQYQCLRIKPTRT